MTEERIVQVFYRLLRDYLSAQQLCDLLNETSSESAVFSDHSVEAVARNLASSL